MLTTKTLHLRFHNCLKIIPALKNQQSIKRYNYQHPWSFHERFTTQCMYALHLHHIMNCKHTRKLSGLNNDMYIHRSSLAMETYIHERQVCEMRVGTGFRDVKIDKGKQESTSSFRLHRLMDFRSCSYMSEISEPLSHSVGHLGILHHLHQPGYKHDCLT